MKNPKNQNAEVLHLLIEKDRSTFDIVREGVLNPSARISNLRKYGVDILCNEVPLTNKFGRKTKYGIFTIVNLAEAVIIYDRINKDDN
jgi:hypothetical protein